MKWNQFLLLSLIISLLLLLNIFCTLIFYIPHDDDDDDDMIQVRTKIEVKFKSHRLMSSNDIEYKQSFKELQ